MSKRKAKTLIDSDSDNDGGSGSDIDDSELLGLSKKKTSNGKDAEPPKSVPKDDSDSETSDSDSDWDVPKNKKRKKVEKASQKGKLKGSESEKDDKMSDSELEEGEVSNSSGNDDDDDDDDGSDSGGSDSDLEFDDGLDENLMGSEEDKARLEQMTEKEREQELFNRIEKREVLKARFEIEKKLKLAKKEQQQKKKKKAGGSAGAGGGAGGGSEAPGGGKEGGGGADKSSKDKKVPATLTDRKKTLEEHRLGKNDKFAALKAKREDRLMKAEEREKKQKEMEEKKRKEKEDRDKSREESDSAEESKAKHKLKSSEVFSSDESDNDDSDDARSTKSEKTTTSAKKKSSSSSTSSSSSSSSSSSDSDSDSGRSDGGSGSQDDSDRKKKRKDRHQLISSKDDVEKIRISRYKMEKFVHLPVFTKAVLGCFVRIGIGNNQGRSVYRVAEVTDVVETAKIYNLGSTRTNKGLKLRHGNQERVFRLEFVSNTSFTDSEFQKWVEACACHSVVLPSHEHIKRKQKDIQDLLYYQFSNDDIEKIIQEKARFNSNPTNFAVAKTLLLKEREMASQKADEDTVNRINSQIAELEEKAMSLDKRRTATIASISYINERNRKNNVEKAEAAIMAEVEERKGMKLEDPFTRRSTRPTMMKTMNTKLEQVMSTELLKKLEEEKRIKMEMENKKKEEEAQRRKVDEEKRRDEDRKKDLSNDPFAAHNFEIKIDLDVNSPGAGATATPLAPRSTPTAATNGTAVSSAPKRSLKFEEYKKKKGLL